MLCRTGRIFYSAEKKYCTGQVVPDHKNKGSVKDNFQGIWNACKGYHHGGCSRGFRSGFIHRNKCLVDNVVNKPFRKKRPELAPILLLKTVNRLNKRSKKANRPKGRDAKPLA